jgi:hypothetical protein
MSRHDDVWLSQRKRLTSSLLKWAHQHFASWVDEGRHLPEFEFHEGAWKVTIKAPAHDARSEMQRRLAVRVLSKHLDDVFKNAAIPAARREWEALRETLARTVEGCQKK